jgi:hypothetical protein
LQPNLLTETGGQFDYRTRSGRRLRCGSATRMR